jgi:hypothetical protein
MRRRFLRAAVVVAFAAALALVPVPSSLIDRWYSAGIFAWIQPTITALTSSVRVAVFDVLLLVAALVVVGTLFVCLRAPRGQRPPRVVRSLLTLVAVAATCYIWFAVLWGLNYRRSPIESGLARAGPVREDAVVELGRQAVQSLNALHGPAHAVGWTGEEWREPELRAAFATTLRLLGRDGRVEPGRLKRSVLGPYFRWTGVDGMISPFTLEVLANPDLLPFERPFVAAHEWAHLAGYADEAEASFVGWLTCVRGAAPTQYSGWLFLLWQVRAEVTEAARRSLDAALAAGARADLAAVAERVQRGAKPQLKRASWAAYDQYLRANRVREGVGSYGRVLTLLTTVRFDADWVPRRVNR